MRKAPFTPILLCLFLLGVSVVFAYQCMGSHCNCAPECPKCPSNCFAGVMDADYYEAVCGPCMLCVNCPPPGTCCLGDDWADCAYTLDTDSSHCGSCGNSCPTGSGCVDGECCPSSQACWDICCPAGEECSYRGNMSGICCPSGQENCGSDCCRTGESCFYGKCCPSGQVCGARTCCSVGFTCQWGAVEGGAVEGRCVPAGCLTNADCSTGKTCVNRACVEESECLTDGDCPSGEICIEGNCIKKLQADCDSTKSCEPGWDCFGFKCYKLIKTGFKNVTIENKTIKIKVTDKGDVKINDKLIQRVTGDKIAITGNGVIVDGHPLTSEDGLLAIDVSDLPTDGIPVGGVGITFGNDVAIFFDNNTALVVNRCLLGLACKNNGKSCASSAECYSGNCEGGACKESACKNNGAGCASSGECCSGYCGDGICRSPPTSVVQGGKLIPPFLRSNLTRDVLVWYQWRTLATTSCIRGSSCSASTDCCGTECSEGYCLCGINACSASGECCSGYCDEGLCRTAPAMSLFLLSKPLQGCAGFVEECLPGEGSCFLICDVLTILLFIASGAAGVVAWRRFNHPGIGAAAAAIPIFIGLLIYTFVGIVAAIVIIALISLMKVAKAAPITLQEIIPTQFLQSILPAMPALPSSPKAQPQQPAPQPQQPAPQPQQPAPQPKRQAVPSVPAVLGIVKKANPTAAFVTTQGAFAAEIFLDKVPITANNFLKLAREGFYNNLAFHRYVPNFVIQGGDPKGDGTGGSKDKIPLEIVKSLTHEKGILGMARGDDPNSASSQFYVTLAESHNLDGGYAVFGKVTEGMEIVGKLRKGDRILKITAPVPEKE